MQTGGLRPSNPGVTSGGKQLLQREKLRAGTHRKLEVVQGGFSILLSDDYPILWIRPGIISSNYSRTSANVGAVAPAPPHTINPAAPAGRPRGGIDRIDRDRPSSLPHFQSRVPQGRTPSQIGVVQGGGQNPLLSDGYRGPGDPAREFFDAIQRSRVCGGCHPHTPANDAPRRPRGGINLIDRIGQGGVIPRGLPPFEPRGAHSAA